MFDRQALRNEMGRRSLDTETTQPFINRNISRNLSGNNGRCQVDYNQHYTTDQIQNDFNEKMHHHLSGSSKTSEKMGYSNERNQSFPGDTSDIPITQAPVQQYPNIVDEVGCSTISSTSCR